MKPITRWVMILDKSGSMAKTKTQTIEGFNELVQQVKEDSKEQEILCSLVSFNGDVYEHLWDVPASQLTEANEADYEPTGATAMLDAVGYTIQKLLDTEPTDNKDIAYMVQIISDGETQNDKYYSESVIRELIQGCQATKRWTITYMGCGNLAEVAKKTAIPLGNIAAWSNSTENATKMAFSNQRARMKKYLGKRARGAVCSSNYASDSDQIANFADEELPLKVEIKQHEIETVPLIDLPELRKKLPEYTIEAMVEATSNNAFSNKSKVKWKTAERQVKVSNLGNIRSARKL
jgi:uncharacterized protein YegL